MVLMLGFRDVLVLTFCLLTHLAYRYCRKSPLPLPPGLPRWPFVGNAFDIPTEYKPIFFKELSKRLGSKILYLKAFGESMIIINDVKIAQDLLDKRSALYSSRPRPRMLVDVLKINYLFPFMPYGDEWRNHRRTFQQYFSPKHIDKAREMELDFVRKGLLVNLYESPKRFSEHLLSCFGGLITAMTYGIPIRRNQDPTVELQEYIFKTSEGAATPGRFLVDIIPALKHIPEWVPGAGFKVLAREWRALLHRIRDEPYQAALKAMDDGTIRECFVSWSLAQRSNQLDSETQVLRIKQTASVTYQAGTETRVSTSLAFILAMLIRPDVQRKAQAEIDAVVGHNRLPDFSDRPHLPYLSAVVKEVLRWNPILPLGVPHLTSNEDVYEGFHIPEGCAVFANAYAMLHDEGTFPNPEKFEPERFIKDGKLKTDILDPEVVATFGFGRRICPGIQVALPTIHLVAASILSLFDILPELDMEGNPIGVVPKFTSSSVISRPLPFPCRIIPRQNEKAEELLKEYMGYEVI